MSSGPHRCWAPGVSSGSRAPSCGREYRKQMYIIGRTALGGAEEANTQRTAGRQKGATALRGRPRSPRCLLHFAPFSL
eukprot:scaffold15463_cov118-Isochrysis_galbana.AAC.1